MAVLNKIRERSIFLIIIIALALFSFVLADVIRNGGFSSGKAENEIASIDGETINREEFALQVERYSQQLGPNASNMQAVNQVYEAQVRELVFKKQLDELGIKVSAEQVNDAMAQQLAGNPNFSDENGNYSPSKVREYEANIKVNPGQYQAWMDFKESIAKSVSENQYFNMIKAGSGATLLEGKQAYFLENNTIDVQYVQIPWSAVEESEAQVSKEEIASYIKTHPDAYTVEAGRDIQYILFEEKASAEDISNINAEITALMNDREENGETIKGFRNTDNPEIFVNANSDVPYNGTYKFKKDLPTAFADSIFNLNEGEVFGPYKDGEAYKLSKLVESRQIPDSVKAKQIFITYSGLETATNVERTKEEAKALTDSLLVELKKDRKKFVTFAGAFSADERSAANGGDLGYLTPQGMTPDFANLFDYIWDNKTGDIGVVETRYGFHIIEIDEQKNRQRAVKVATIVKEIEASEDTNNDLYTETTKFEIAARDGDFAEAAKTANKTPRPVRGIKALDENIPGVGRQRTIVSWAFKDETKVGDIKRFEVPQGYVVAQVTGENKKGLMNLEDASVTVTPIIQQKKKTAIIKNRISGNSIEDVAKNQGVEIKTSNALNLSSPTIAGAGNEPEVVGAAFALKEGEMSKPIQGKNGVYVVKVVKRTDATTLENYKAYAAQETNKTVNTVNARVYNALKEAADIKDNRSKFY